MKIKTKINLYRIGKSIEKDIEHRIIFYLIDGLASGRCTRSRAVLNDLDSKQFNQVRKSLDDMGVKVQTLDLVLGNPYKPYITNDRAIKHSI